MINQTTSLDSMFSTIDESVLADIYAETVQCDEDIHADLSGDDYAEAMLRDLGF